MSDTYDYEPDPTEDFEPEPVAVKPEVDYNNLQCKFCHKEGFHWEKSKKGKYYMATAKGTKHVCREMLTGFQKIPKEKKK